VVELLVVMLVVAAELVDIVHQLQANHQGAAVQQKVSYQFQVTRPIQLQ
jgi:hypothetical protein